MFVLNLLVWSQGLTIFVTLWPRLSVIVELPRLLMKYVPLEKNDQTIDYNRDKEVKKWRATWDFSYRLE
jgi:hypothetical protein